MLALPIIFAGHWLVWEITARTDYSICLSQLKVITPERRTELVLEYLQHQKADINAIRNCCNFPRRAGDFGLTYNDYLDNGAVRYVEPLNQELNLNFPYAYFTNCGEVMDEQTFTNRYIN